MKPLGKLSGPHTDDPLVRRERDVCGIADALGLRPEPLDGEQVDGWDPGVVETFPLVLSWWRLSNENDVLFVAVGVAGELYVSPSLYRVPGPEPILFVEPAGTKLVTTEEEALEEARRILRNRRRSYRRCHFCGEKTPPEWGERMETEDGQAKHFVCHGCMSEELGVVF